VAELEKKSLEDALQASNRELALQKSYETLLSNVSFQVQASSPGRLAADPKLKATQLQ
jgi:hypothetical protein